jgi:hypothetical protein
MMPTFLWSTVDSQLNQPVLSRPRHGVGMLMLAMYGKEPDAPKHQAQKQLKAALLAQSCLMQIFTTID